MEERKMVRATRVTILTDNGYSPLRWETVKKVQVPDTDVFDTLRIESIEEKVYDDEGGTVWRDHWVLRTEYFRPETDKEVIERMQSEEKQRNLKEIQDQRDKDREYLNYLRLKTKYEGGVESNDRPIDLDNL